MKKFLLSLTAAVFCMGAAFADADITLANISPFKSLATGSNTLTDEQCSFGGGDFAFVVAKGDSSTTTPAYNGTSLDLRLYYDNTFTATATNNMTQIVFTLSAQGKKRLPEITASTGTIATQATGDETVTWTGDASTVTFTVGQKAVYGTDGETKAGQFDFTAFSITGGGEFTDAGDDDDDDDTTDEPNFQKATTVEDNAGYVWVANGKYNSTLFSKNYGYMSTAAVPDGTTTEFYGATDGILYFVAVDGGYNITTSAGKYLGAKSGYNTFDTTDDSADNRVWTVTFDTDGVATVYNVATSKTVAMDATYGSFGVYDASALDGKVLPEMFKYVGADDEPPTPSTATFELATSIVSGNDYVMVVDSQVGTVIDQSSSYGRLSLADVTITDGKLTTELNNAITITAEGTGYTMKDVYGRYLGFDGTHTTSFQLYSEASEYDIWDIAFTNDEAAITLTANDVTGQVGVTQDSSGTWYTNIAPSVGADTIKLPSLYVKISSKLNDVTVSEENAPVEYFNLQGVRVANPENGFYIRRQGNSVSKVILK